MQEIDLAWDAECGSCGQHIERGARFGKSGPAVCSRCLNSAARTLHEAAANANRIERSLGRLLPCLP